MLYPHQMGALEATEGRNHVAYYLDMGLGKTYVGAEKMQLIGNAHNLLICQKSKILDWVEHFAEHTDLTPHDLTKGKCAIREFLEPHDHPIVGVINYELAWRRPELLRLVDFTLMLDESSLIQNRQAKQTKFVMRLKPSAVILLSGTPTAGKYENLWTQAHLLGWEIGERAYQNAFVNWVTKEYGGIRLKVVDKINPYKNVERLRRKFREHGAIFMKTEEVMSMPKQNFVPVKVTRANEYDHFMDEGIVILKDGTEIVGDTSLTKRLRARQLCGQHCKAKIDAFADLLASTDNRLVVFYNFNEELKVLLEACGERPVSIVNGETKDLGAYETHENSVTLVQYQAGAMGLNLQLSNKVIYFTPPERSDLFEQSKKRIHRIGQNRPCFYYLLICKNTIERDIYKALEQRRDYTDELFRKGTSHE